MLRTRLQSMFVDRCLGIMSICGFSIAILSYAILGMFQRYIADDYLTAAVLRSEGFIGAQVFWYNQQYGRFAFTFLVSVVETFGVEIVPMLPAMVVGFWLAALSWLVLQLSLILHLSRPMIACLALSQLLIFSTLDSTPNIAESFYWQTGMLTYLTPVVLATVQIGLLVHVLRRQAKERPSLSVLLLSAALCLFAGGFSESYAFMQAAALFVLVVVCVATTPGVVKTVILPLAVSGLVGSVVALGVIGAAPGNALRQAALIVRVPLHPGLWSLITMTLSGTFQFVTGALLRSPFVLGTSLIFPAVLAFTLHPFTFQPTSQLNHQNQLPGTGLILTGLLLSGLSLFADLLGIGPHGGFGNKQIAVLVVGLLLVWSGIALHRKAVSGRLLLTMALFPLVGLFLIALYFVPAVYVFFSIGPDRAHVFPQFILITTTACIGYCLGLALKQKQTASAASSSARFIIVETTVVAILLLCPLRSAYRNFALIPMERSYAAAWDDRDREIRMARLAGAKDLEVLALSHTGEGYLGTDPKAWVNSMVAQYYGLNSIVAK